MPNSPTIKLPSGYAPAYALAFRDATGEIAFVGADTPLPTSASVSVSTNPEPAAPAPLTGSTATALVSAPFRPVRNRAVVVTLSGTWTGSVRLLRSTDSGVTKLSVTAGGMPWGVYDVNVCEAAWSESEAGVDLYLDLAPVSGTVAYRLAQ